MADEEVRLEAASRPDSALLALRRRSADVAEHIAADMFNTSLPLPEPPAHHPLPAIDENARRRRRKSGQVGGCCAPFCRPSRIRFFILFISVIFLTFTRANDLAYNLTVLCMTSNSTINDITLEMKPQEISTIFASVGVGALLTVLPLTHAQHIWGSRLVFSVLLAASSLATLAIGPLAKIAPLWMIPARLFQGAALACVMPIMGAVSAEWAPVSEIGIFMTLLSGASQLSQIITMPLSAQLCVTSGWSSVYFVIGGLSGVVAIAFYLCYRNSPEGHSCVDTEELTYITKGEKPKRPSRIPYAEIFRSKAVWAVWIAFLGNSVGFQLIIQYLPTYMNKVLLVPIKQTGMSAIIPPLAQLAVKLTAVAICDRITFLSERRKLQVFNSIAMVGCGLFFLPLGFLDADSNHHHLAILCFTLSLSSLGIVTCGSLKCVPLVARSFSPFVMGVTQLVVCMSALLVPFTVSMLAPDHAITQWRVIFVLACSLLCATNVVFCCLCSATAEPWAVDLRALPPAEKSDAIVK